MPWYIVTLYIGSVVMSCISCIGNNSTITKQFNHIGFILLAVLVWLIACEAYGF